MAAVMVCMVGSSAARATSTAQADQAFLAQLAQQAQTAPATCSLANADPGGVIIEPAIICTGAFCQKQADCSACPGGLEAWFCNNNHRCQPF
jgi:hypothetical protein